MIKNDKVSILDQVFLVPEKIFSVLVKKITPNDDAGGKHGVVIPVESYPMFPCIAGFTPEIEQNYTEDFISIWADNVRIESKLKHYHRYPERRITRLDPRISDLPKDSLIVFGKRSDAENSYEVHYFAPEHKLYFSIVNEFSIDPKAKSSFAIDLNWTGTNCSIEQPSISLFLSKFDKINELGFIKSLRKGDTGIGYTFETLMGIEENNNSGPDFEGIELKCYSLEKTSNKHNLFLKEPKWIDGLARSRRLEKYGYFDQVSQRFAMYSGITARTNSHCFKLTVNRKEKRVYINFKNMPVAFWTFEILEERLNEKLTDSMFIGAKVKKNKTEYFHYLTANHCAEPFIDSLVSLIEVGDIIVELRMHINEKGSVRNHGTAFRIVERQLPELYARVQKLR